MLARLYVLLPYSITLPDGEEFTVYQYEDDGYTIAVFPPGRSDRVKSLDAPDEIKIGGKPGFEAEVLRLDFRKESFSRAIAAPLDPPEALVARALRSFHQRLRYVTRAFHARPPDFPSCSWRIEYLNDDESKLEQKEGFRRGLGGLQYSWSMIGVNRAVWNDIFGLGTDFTPPVWDELRLDAIAALPNIGTAVVLASASLEVFISHLLDQLAEKGKAPQGLWSWINSRGDWRREPDVEEQFDQLLKFFTGHSLKEEAALWEAFKNLKTARNSFVHEGVPKVGNVPLSLEQARDLVGRSNNVIAKIREWIPNDLHWLEFNNKLEVSIHKVLMKGGPSNTGAEPTPDAGAAGVER